MLYRIKVNRNVLPHYHHMVVQAPDIASKVAPGMFILVQVSAEGAQDPLLRRPFSVMNATSGGSIEILYKIVGRGTAMMSRMRPGDKVDITGPFGNGFILPEVHRRSLLVGGGAGIPPLYFLASRLAQKREADILAFLGGKTRMELPLVQEFIALGIKTEITTDDGSLGKKGMVTNLLATHFKYHQFKSDLIYACGPDSMLKRVAQIAKTHTVGAQLSLEEHMACGIGACMGCTVQTVKGPQRVCSDGPVFYANELRKWS